MTKTSFRYSRVRTVNQVTYVYRVRLGYSAADSSSGGMTLRLTESLDDSLFSVPDLFPAMLQHERSVVWFSHINELEVASQRLNIGTSPSPTLTCLTTSLSRSSLRRLVQVAGTFEICFPYTSTRSHLHLQEGGRYSRGAQPRL